MVGEGSGINPEVIDPSFESTTEVIVLFCPTAELKGENTPRVDAGLHPISAHGSIHVHLNVRSRVDMSHVSPTVPHALAHVDVGIPAPVLRSELAVIPIPKGTDCPSAIITATSLANTVWSGLTSLSVFNIHPKRNRARFVSIYAHGGTGCIGGNPSVFGKTQRGSEFRHSRIKGNVGSAVSGEGSDVSLEVIGHFEGRGVGQAFVKSPPSLQGFHPDDRATESNGKRNGNAQLALTVHT